MSETPENKISQNLLIFAQNLAGLIQYLSGVLGTWESINLVFVLSENKISSCSMQNGSTGWALKDRMV